MNKNWSNGLRIDYKACFSLVELIEVNGKLEKKLKKFERLFEMMRFWKYNLLIENTM